MAYGVLAGLPPVAGLWAAIPSLALYAFIGYRAWESELADGRHRPPPADAQPDARADS